MLNKPVVFILGIITGILLAILSAIIGVTFCEATDITHSLSVIPISPQEAAEKVKYTGTIDSAYRIGEVVVIVSDGVHHAFGNGKGRRFSGEVKYSIEDEPWQQTPKEFTTPHVLGYDQPGDLLDGCMELGKTDKLKCFYEKNLENNNLSLAISDMDYLYDVLVDKLAKGEGVESEMADVGDKMCSTYKEMITQLSDDEQKEHSRLLNRKKANVLKLNLNCFK